MKYLYQAEGEGCIVARVVAYSTSPTGQEIITYELEYPRFIHGELMTHRLFSRNAMSSRAVPIEKMIEQVRNNPAKPIHWGKNQSGMQAKEEQDTPVLDQIGQEFSVEEWWELSAEEAAVSAEALSEAGYHKQIVNRLLEPFQVMKTVLTSTCMDNFFHLRCHEDAQPEIRELADCMLVAMSTCSPEKLKEGEWHTPYVEHFRGSGGNALLEYHTNNLGVSIEDALKISASCCAQVSFRVCDDALDKAIRVYDRLVDSKPVHASPFEHQAKVMQEVKWPEYCDPSVWLGVEEDGVTHADREGYYWSGNFKGWIQHRQLIKDNVCLKFK